MQTIKDASFLRGIYSAVSILVLKYIILIQHMEERIHIVHKTIFNILIAVRTKTLKSGPATSLNDDLIAWLVCFCMFYD